MTNTIYIEHFGDNIILSYEKYLIFVSPMLRACKNAPKPAGFGGIRLNVV
jgi:uncharacterized protein (UPF0128 family)